MKRVHQIVIKCMKQRGPVPVLVSRGAAIPTQLDHGNMEGKNARACWWSWRRICENLDARSVDFFKLG